MILALINAAQTTTLVDARGRAPAPLVRRPGGAP